MRKPLYAALAVFLIASGAVGDPVSTEDTVPRDQVAGLADKEFAELRAAQPDARQLRAIDMTERIFNFRLRRIPQDKFSVQDIHQIDAVVGPIIKITRKYLDALKPEMSAEEVKAVSKNFADQIAEFAAKHGGTGGGIDRDILSHTAAEAARTAMRRLQPPSQGSGAPPVGDALGSGDGPVDPYSQMASARDAEVRGDRAGALRLLTQAVDGGGGAEALVARGALENEMKMYSAAERDGRAALALDPQNADARAIVAYSSGHGAEGSSSVGPAPAAESSIDPAAFSSGSKRRGISQADLRGAEEALGIGDAQAAIRALDRAAAAHPDDEKILRLRALAQAAAGDSEKAGRDASAALAKNPSDALLREILSWSKLLHGDAEGALSEASRAREINRGDARARALEAYARGALGDVAGMRAGLGAAAALDARYAEAAASGRPAATDDDLRLLFSGSWRGASPEAPPRPAPARAGILVAAVAVGGLLIAWGLLGARRSRGESALAAFVPPPGPAPAPSLRSKRYEVVRQIGAGGMGLVYEAVDPVLERRVAIKLLREELRGNPKDLARFIEEAKIVAGLRHRHIVEIFEIDEGPDGVTMVFEFVSGKTIHELIGEYRRLVPVSATAILRATAEAIDYAHSQGVIHRDLKPSNIMVDDEGLVKVMDFGIARVAKDAAVARSAVATVIGTPQYMAPEQEMGQLGAASDVYSLAVCAYEMLTGTVPFAGAAGGITMNKISKTYPPVSAAGLPTPLDAVFDRALEPDPEKRYRTAGEFVAALAAALPGAGGPVIMKGSGVNSASTDVVES